VLAAWRGNSRAVHAGEVASLGQKIRGDAIKSKLPRDDRPLLDKGEQRAHERDHAAVDRRHHDRADTVDRRVLGAEHHAKHPREPDRRCPSHAEDQGVPNRLARRPEKECSGSLHPPQSPQLEGSRRRKRRLFPPFCPPLGVPKVVNFPCTVAAQPADTAGEKIAPAACLGARAASARRRGTPIGRRARVREGTPECLSLCQSRTRASRRRAERVSAVGEL